MVALTAIKGRHQPLEAAPSFQGAHSILATYWKAVTQSRRGSRDVFGVSDADVHRHLKKFSQVMRNVFDIVRDVFVFHINFSRLSEAHRCIEH